ncbi:MAG: hypothetical protein JRE57_05590 [Deltaproteobacteria bacterium]|nr:hypothetical protein [Deltaproteobacteria bacterium]
MRAPEDQYDASAISSCPIHNDPAASWPVDRIAGPDARWPDPAVEDICTKWGFSGNVNGLCNVYCEAMGCDSANPQASDQACNRVLDKNVVALGDTPFPTCQDVDDDGVSRAPDKVNALGQLGRGRILFVGVRTETCEQFGSNSNRRGLIDSGNRDSAARFPYS